MVLHSRGPGWVKSLGLSLLLVMVLSSFSAVNNFAVQFAAGAEGTDDWPMFHHDLQRNGYSTSVAPSINQTQWHFPTSGGMQTSPAVTDGKIYVGSMDDKVYCLDAASGASIWSYTTGDDVYSSAAVVGDNVYVGSSDHKVYCLNAATGAFIWSYTTYSSVTSSPAVADGKVYIGSDDDKIYCLNALTGAQIWNYTTGWHVHSSPAVADGKVYIGSQDHMVYCLDAASGASIWSYTTGDDVYSSPTVIADKVYVGSDDDKVYCLSTATGALIWSYTTGGDVDSSPAVADGKVYVGSYDGKVYCLDAMTGAFVWSYTTGWYVYSSPAVADGKVYVGSWDDKVYCLNAATGALIWNYATSGLVYSSPAVADGVVYVASSNNVYAFCSPFIWNFNNALKFNSVRMIYPSDRTPKPLGCVAALISDWSSSTFIYTKLNFVVEGIDTDGAFVNQITGKPTGAAGTGIVSFGGPIVNPVVAYAENDATPIGDRAPIRFYQNAGTCYFQLQDGTSIAGASLPSSTVNGTTDMFLIESFRDGDGRNVMLCYGFGWKGTYAAGKYFSTEIYPNLTSYPYNWMIVQWSDANGDGFVNTAADGDTYTVIATGQRYGAQLGYNNNWNYRKSHVINAAAGAGTNYQVKVVVHRGSGIDIGEDVYLNSKCRSDFGDVRFTAADGSTLLDYWMESKINNDNAVFWVEVSADLSIANQTIYIYYDNPIAASTSNGANTFLFFDDFSSSPHGWALNSSSISNGELHVSSGGSAYKQRSETNENWRFKFKQKVSAPVQWRARCHGSNSAAFSYNPGCNYWSSYDSCSYQYVTPLGMATNTISKPMDYNYHMVEVLKAGMYYETSWDTTSSNTVTDIVSLKDYYVVYCETGYHSEYSLYVDWVFIGKYVNPEPSHGAWGQEEPAILT